MRIHHSSFQDIFFREFHPPIQSIFCESRIYFFFANPVYIFANPGYFCATLVGKPPARVCAYIGVIFVKESTIFVDEPTICLYEPTKF